MYLYTETKGYEPFKLVRAQHSPCTSRAVVAVESTSF